MNTLIIVIAHTPLASALKEVAMHVFEAAKEIMVYDIKPDDAPEEIQANIMQDIQQYEAVDQVLVLGDLVGATPANIGVKVAQLLNQQGINSEFFSGTNVCMLLNAVCYRSLPLDALEAKILEGGQKGMKSIDCTCQSS
ncbi:hypothetical protein F9B74_07810 [Pelistega sp. NLN82]|uniref:PTS EIIA type-4 domain-containing protein n=1 Tax=Pelistega ratti TaxID=2652177 RepID=A0A6L9Y796_9BURK|nr:hypothetical protein [Pelistega ratti]NEN76226.1 hypothetical protein [Pelistega ratti]